MANECFSPQVQEGRDKLTKDITEIMKTKQKGRCSKLDEGCDFIEKIAKELKFNHSDVHAYVFLVCERYFNVCKKNKKEKYGTQYG